MKNYNFSSKFMFRFSIFCAHLVEAHVRDLIWKFQLFTSFHIQVIFISMGQVENWRVVPHTDFFVVHFQKLHNLTSFLPLKFHFLMKFLISFIWEIELNRFQLEIVFKGTELARKWEKTCQNSVGPENWPLAVYGLNLWQFVSFLCYLIC